MHLCENWRTLQLTVSNRAVSAILVMFLESRVECIMTDPDWSGRWRMMCAALPPTSAWQWSLVQSAARPGIKTECRGSVHVEIICGLDQKVETQYVKSIPNDHY